MKIVIILMGLLQAPLAIAQNSPDSVFAKEAAQAGMLEVKLGELAKSKASSKDVKMLGQHMITDHTKANNELKAVAAKKKMTVPTGLSSEGQMNYDRLSKLSGQDFDKAYSQLMVEDHEKVIAKFRTEANSGQDPDLKALASKTLPTLEHHLMMSKETDAKINK